MADTPNTPQPSAQQSFDAQQMDNQALQQPSAGDATASPARADVSVATSNVGNQDGPSILNNLSNNQGNQDGPNLGNIRAADAANVADGNNLGGADGGVARVFGSGGVNPFSVPVGPVVLATPLAEARAPDLGAEGLSPALILPNTFNNITVPLVADAVVDTVVDTNNAPIISFTVDQDIGYVKEDSKLTTSGQFTSSDVDSATAIWSVEGPSDPSDDYGSMVVDPSGKWTYALNAKANSLAADEFLKKIYTITVTDDEGAFDTQEVTIIIQGTNDAPVIFAEVGKDDVGIVEDDAELTATGQLISTDVDILFTTATWDIVGSNTSDFGSIVVDQTGKWTYTLDSTSEEVQDLAIGESYMDFFTISVTDDKGVFDTQEVTITIQGTNDVPELNAGNVREENKPTASGQFVFINADDSSLTQDDWSIENPSDPSDEYGSLKVGPSGKWKYTLNNSEKVNGLAEDESFEMIYIVTVNDGNGGVDSEEVTIIIRGTNDEPVISAKVGQDAGTVEDNTELTATGKFTSTDVDILFTTATWGIVGNDSSDFGSIVVDQTGRWIYTLDTTSLLVQGLAVGESIKDVFTISVTDEKGGVDTKDVTITILSSIDTITGDVGINVISSGAGKDIIIGAGNADILTGGIGPDIFQYTSTSDLTTTPEAIEEITDFSSADGDRIDFTSLLSSAANLTNTIKIDPTDGNGSSTNNLVSFSIGGSTYLMDVNNANPGAGSPGSFYSELDSQALLGNPALGTQASWTDVVDLQSSTGFRGDTGIDSITGDGWTLKVLDSGVTYQENVVPGGTSSMEFFRGADKAFDVNVQITTSDGVVHDVSNADKITWHG